jgi:hypothetical protein
MAALHSVKASPGRNRLKAKLRRREAAAARLKASTVDVTGWGETGTRRTVRVAARLKEFLKQEQEELIKTQSLIVCVTKAMEPEHGPGGPYYPDILKLAANLLRQRVVNMDELLLQGLVPQGASKHSSDSDYLEC